MNAMALASLPRISSLPPIFNFPKGDFIDKADRYLGYKQLEVSNREANFLKLLEKIGTLPFEPAKVEEYKEKKRSEALGWKLWSKTDWYMCRFSTYPHPVPVSVIQTALELVQVTSGTGVRIDYLGSLDYQQTADREAAAKRREMEMYDPFLVVRAGEGHPWHHIAVWDEPTFQG